MGTLDEDSDHAQAVGDDLQAKRDLSHPEHDCENLEGHPGPFQDRIFDPQAHQSRSSTTRRAQSSVRES